jgi:hypothetical protein
MLQLLRYLIFGKECKHEWKCDKSLTPYINSEKHIYICQKCGKIKVVSLRIKVWS